MKITIAAKIKILPTEEQIIALKETMFTYRKACNYVSQIVFEEKAMNQLQLHKRVYQELRHGFGLRSQMSQSVMKTVIARYKTNKSNGHPPAIVHFKRPEYDLVWNRDYSLTKNLFSINTLQGRVKMPFTTKGMAQYFEGTWTFGTAKLVHKHDKWFLHIPVTMEIDALPDNDIGQIVGIDLGINFVATTYDSNGKTTFVKGRSIKHKRAKYKNTRKQLQKKQTPSARRRLKEFGNRENRWMMDVNHTVSKALVTKYGKGTLFVLEDLSGIRNATEKVRIKERYTSVSWSFLQLRQMIEYKAILNGAKTIAVNPKYTSQTCPKCGHREKCNRNKKKHLFCCQKCQYISNDDRIGAMNLHKKGNEYLLDAVAKRA